MSSSGTPAGATEDALDGQRDVRRALEEAQERWRLILETANDAYIAIDTRSRILAWNRRAEELLGWSSPEVIGRQLDEVVIPERFRAAHREGIERYQRTGEGPVLFRRIRLPALHRDGHEIATEITIWPSPAGDGERFNAFLRDVRERERMERDAELTQRVTVAANATSDVRHVVSHAIEDVCRTLGWPVGHAYVREDGSDRLAPTDWWYVDDPAFGPFRDITEGTGFVRGKGLPGRVLATAEPDWIGDIVQDDNFPRFATAAEVGLRTALAFPVVSGERVEAVLEFYSYEPTEPDVQVLELMGTIGTQLGRVFERQRARAALQQTNEELREANELKSRLVSVVSHELRSPLTAIHGFAELLREDWTATPEDEKRELIRSIERQAERLFRLVEDLLTLSRLESQAVEAKRERVEVGPVVETIAVDLGISDDLDVVGADHASVLVERDHLVQILVNFLTNAIRYGAPPFRIEIRVGSAGADGHVDLRTCDAGPGVPADFVPRLFDPFTRAKVTDGEGTGLGLSIVRGLAAANDGSAWYEDLDPGACFVVRLPAAD